MRFLTLPKMSWKPRYFDIGVNFSDLMFQGRYHGSETPKHPCDLENVIARARLFGVNRMLITASNIEESMDHFDLVKEHPGSFTSTVGVHPCSVAQEFYGGLENEKPLPDLETKLDKLKTIAIEGRAKGYVGAFGEIGLDYDRLHYLTVEQQREMFKRQLEVHASLKDLNLPLFLHMRAACDDFVTIIKPFLEQGSIPAGHGVVHSFTGTEEELAKILDLGFYVGVNGCSLKTQENLHVAKLIPIDRLLIETDAPWCEIRKSHASYPMISRYPSIFYPRVEIRPKEESESDLLIKSKKLATSQKSTIKLDDLLPFPSIKKENWAKHKALAQQKLERSTAATTEIGEFAPPLIRSRNEPVFVGCVASVMAHLHGITAEEDIKHFIDTIYTNSCTLFRI